ncbi:MAG: hypothetical protein M0Z72_04675 [Deltaproteobacteria bacterium]|nr:hypothetical protein [Deltaproteobacteria bacterium]
MNKYKIKIRGIGIKPAIIEVEGEPVNYPEIVGKKIKVSIEIMED